MVRVIHENLIHENLLQLISEFLFCILQANLYNYMIYSNSVTINADTFTVFHQPTLSVILNFSGDPGIRIILYLKFIS